MNHITPSPDEQAVLIIRSLLEGNSPNGADPDSYGKWSDIVAALIEAHESGGNVRQVFTALSNHNPALAVLVSADQRPETDLDAWIRQLKSIQSLGKRLPPIRYLVGGLIEETSLNIVYGAPGCYKSFILADMAVCIASGTRWLQPLPNQEGCSFPTTKTPVLWLDFDNGNRRTDERFTALKHAHTLPDITALDYLSMPSPWFDASDWERCITLIGLIKHQNAGLVILDNLGTIAGGKDENSGEMIQVMANLRRVCEETKAALIMIHHQRKATATSGGRSGDSLRGHSSIEAALDLALKVERELGAESLTVTATKTRGVDVPSFGALFTYGHYDNGNDLVDARFWSYETEDCNSMGALDDAIISFIKQGNGPTQGELLEHIKTETGRGKNTTLARLKLLETSDRVKREKDPFNRNAVRYYTE